MPMRSRSSVNASAASSRSVPAALTRSAGATSIVSWPRSTTALRSLSPSAVESAACSVSSVAAMLASRDGVGAADLVLQLQQPVNQRLRRRRAAWHVDVHGHDAVAAAHDRVRVVVVAAAVRARSHRDHPARLGHLVVHLTQRGRHLVAERAGDDHDVGLARARPEDDAEAVEVVARGPGVHHLDRAAREPEGHRPERSGARPVEYRVDLGHDEALLRDSFFHHSHSRAPFFHSYTNPTTRIARKTIMAMKPNQPMSCSTIAHGKRNAISRSKRMKRIATR